MYKFGLRNNDPVSWGSHKIFPSHKSAFVWRLRILRQPFSCLPLFRNAASVSTLTKWVDLQNEWLPYKMKGHFNFLPCFGIIQDVLGLIEVDQNGVNIQVLDAALSQPIPVALEAEK